MLSPNTLLNKARYRVVACRLATPDWTLYSAEDRSAASNVVVIECAGPEPTPPTIDHDGLVLIRDSFFMNGRHYDVTEPLVSRSKGSLSTTWDRFAVILMALHALTASRGRRYEIRDEMILGVDGRAKLLALPAATREFGLDAAYAPLELLWKDLDHISQKAIYNAWDTDSVDALEREPDDASDLYSLAASFYRQITGIPPVTAFERMVMELDGPDPLVPPAELVPQLGSDASAFLMKCMSQRRDQRFASFETAVMSLPALPTEAVIDHHETQEVVEHVILDSPNLVSSEESFPELIQDEPLQIVDKPRDPNDIHFPEVITLEPGDLPGPVHLEENDVVFTIPEAPARRGRKVMALAAATLLVAGGVGWGVLQYQGLLPLPEREELSLTPPAAEQVQLPQLSDEGLAPQKDQTDRDQRVPEQTTQVSAPGSSMETIATVRAELPRPQRAQLQTKTPPTTEQKARKKVTVDDLINDN